MKKILIEFVDEELSLDCCENNFFERINQIYEYKFCSRTKIKKFLLYIYKCLNVRYIPTDDELQERFKIKVNKKYIKPNIYFNLQKFLLLNNIKEKIFVHYAIGLPGGNGASIDDLASLRINPNEGRHKYIPHIHIYKKNRKNCVRIELINLTEMKGEEGKLAKLFDKNEQKQIVCILKKYQNKFIDYYEMIQRGAAPMEFTIEYNNKNILFK